MKKELKKRTFWSTKKIIIVIVFITLLVCGILYGRLKITYYTDSANQASISQIRELILLSIRSIKKDAPVEPRTGDIYFPESKLYLPNPGTVLPFTYLFDTRNITAESVLSVSTYPVRGTTALYTAKNNTELFDAVPKLQACSRGIKLIYEKLPQTNTQNSLKQTVQLNNGKTLYVYLEKACPDLSDTADLFKNIKAY